MPVSIDPKDQAVWNYIVGRKTPVTIKQAMKTLLISETHARRALDYFVLKGLAEMTKQGGVRLYRVKE
jgi:predicted DNA-binding transcriptional regulator